MRRAFAFAPSTIALLVVALLASAAGIAVSFADDANARLAAAHEASPAGINQVDGRATEPVVPARMRFLHAQTTSTGRVHAPRAHGGDGARSTVALGVDRVSLDLTARHASRTAADARQNGVASPGQPAPSSRAPPLG